LKSSTIKAIFNSNVNGSNFMVNLASIGQAGPARQLGGIRGIVPAEFHAEVVGDHGIVGGLVEVLVDVLVGEPVELLIDVLASLLTCVLGSLLTWSLSAGLPSGLKSGLRIRRSELGNTIERRAWDMVEDLGITGRHMG
jgi:hypothetical protein